jgi:hypothetical protein
MENPTQTLLAEIEQFLARTETPPTKFGWEAVRDPNFVRSLRAGREPRFGTMQRVNDYIAQAQKESAA